MLKLKDVTPLPDEPLVLQGEFDPPVTIEKLTDKLTEILGRVPYVVPVDSPPSIRRVAFAVVRHKTISKKRQTQALRPT